jgi:NAD(P)H-dependent flavin oxidoreductase YrpB (nitropropane dioxygenase family)
MVATRNSSSALPSADFDRGARVCRRVGVRLAQPANYVQQSVGLAACEHGSYCRVVNTGRTAVARICRVQVPTQPAGDCYRAGVLHTRGDVDVDVDVVVDGARVPRVQTRFGRTPADIADVLMRSRELGLPSLGISRTWPMSGYRPCARWLGAGAGWGCAVA